MPYVMKVYWHDFYFGLFVIDCYHYMNANSANRLLELPSTKYEQQFGLFHCEKFRICTSCLWVATKILEADDFCANGFIKGDIYR